MSRKMKKPSPSASPKRRRGSDPLQLPRTTKASNDFPLLNLQDVRRGMSEVTSGKDERPFTRSPVIPPKEDHPYQEPSSPDRVRASVAGGHRRSRVARPSHVPPPRPRHAQPPAGPAAGASPRPNEAAHEQLRSHPARFPVR